MRKHARTLRTGMHFSAEADGFAARTGGSRHPKPVLKRSAAENSEVARPAIAERVNRRAACMFRYCCDVLPAQRDAVRGTLMPWQRSLVSKCRGVRV